MGFWTYVSDVIQMFTLRVIVTHPGPGFFMVRLFFAVANCQNCRYFSSPLPIHLLSDNPKHKKRPFH